MIVATARTAAELLAPHFAEDGETVVVLHLGPGRELLATSLIEPGSTGEAGLPVRAIVAAALGSGAASLIVAWSRAGGDPTPREADRAGARLLADAAAAAGIRLADVFIFAGGDCRSFRELRLL